MDTPLSRYTFRPPPDLHHYQLPSAYETTGNATQFTNALKRRIATGRLLHGVTIALVSAFAITERAGRACCGPAAKNGNAGRLYLHCHDPSPAGTPTSAADEV